jgi:O-antigen/teichoic acid export membrane protein
VNVTSTRSTPLARLAARGTLWLGLVNVLSKGAQMLVILTLGTFLDERQLGTVTITVTVVNVAQIIQTMGVFDVISRTTHPAREFAGSVATMSVATAVVLGTALVAGAAPVAAWLGVPDAAPLLRVAGISLPFSAYAGSQLAYLHRTLEFHRRLLPDTGSALAGAAVTIVGAAAGFGSWSLVAGVLTTAVLAPFLGLVAGVRLPLRAHREHMHETLHWVAVTGPGAIIGVLLLQVDYIVVTRALGPEANGVYSFAYRIAFVPYITVAVVLGAVAFPVFTRLTARPGTTPGTGSGPRPGSRPGSRTLARSFARFWHVLLAVTGGLYLMLWLLADRIVVIDPRWADSAPVLRVLCGYGLLLGLLTVAHDAVRAIGRPTTYLWAMALHLVLLVGGAIAGAELGGITGVAWAQVTAVTVTLLVVAHVLVRSGVLDRSAAAVLRGPLPAAVVTVAVHTAAGRAGLLPDLDSVGGALILGPLLGLIYLGVLTTLDRAAVGDLRTALARDRAAENENHENENRENKNRENEN